MTTTLTPDERRAKKTRMSTVSRLRSLERERGATFPTDFVDAERSILLVKNAFRTRPGATVAEISRLTGLGTTCIRRLSKLRYTGSETVYRATEKKLVETLDEPDTRSHTQMDLVPVTKSKQIVHSLYAQGYTKDHLSYIIKNNLGVSGHCVREVTECPNGRIRRKTADRIEWLAQAIGDSVGPSLILRRRELNRGNYPLKHYNAKGELLPSTISEKQRAIYGSV